MNPMFHFLFIFGSFLRFRRRVWFTVAIFGSFFISFLVHFHCQLNMVGSKNEPKMRSKMTQKRPKSATVSTSNASCIVWDRCVDVWTLRSRRRRHHSHRSRSRKRKRKNQSLVVLSTV